jgi:hypothetical protein
LGSGSLTVSDQQRITLALEAEAGRLRSLAARLSLIEIETEDAQ